MARRCAASGPVQAVAKVEAGAGGPERRAAAPAVVWQTPSSITSRSRWGERLGGLVGLDGVSRGCRGWGVEERRWCRRSGKHAPGHAFHPPGHTAIPPQPPHLLAHQPVHRRVRVHQLHHHPVQCAHQRARARPGRRDLSQHGAVEVQEVGGWWVGLGVGVGLRVVGVREAPGMRMTKPTAVRPADAKARRAESATIERIARRSAPAVYLQPVSYSNSSSSVTASVLRSACIHDSAYSRRRSRQSFGGVVVVGRRVQGGSHWSSRHCARAGHSAQPKRHKQARQSVTTECAHHHTNYQPSCWVGVRNQSPVRSTQSLGASA